MVYIAWYHPHIKTCLETYPHLKERFKKKKDYIIKNPIELGEPLQGNLNGLRSFPFADNFIIIYVVCEECRQLRHQETNNCLQCGAISDNSVIFLTFGRHDPTYKFAPSLRLRLEDREFEVPA